MVSSSKSIKKDIKDIEDNGLFSKLKFKQYLKKIKDEDVFEYGVIFDDLKEIDPENNYKLYMSKEGQDGERTDYVNYNKIFVLTCNELQKLKSRIDELENKLKK